MLWLLLAPAALPLLGPLVRVLVALTPTLAAKLFVADLLVARPFRLLDRGLYEEVAREVRWIVMARHGPRKERALWAKVLEQARG